MTPASMGTGQEESSTGNRDRLDRRGRQRVRQAPTLVHRQPIAARAYLDVCFFHPFDAGNARCAFLVIVFVLVLGCEDVSLNSVRLPRRVAFQADRPQDALAVARYIDVHLAETASLESHGIEDGDAIRLVLVYLWRRR